MSQFVSCIKSNNGVIYRDFFDCNNKITDQVYENGGGVRNVSQFTPNGETNTYMSVIFQQHVRNGQTLPKILKYNDLSGFTKNILQYMQGSSYRFQLVKYDVDGIAIDIMKDDPILPFFKEHYSQSITDW